MSEWELWSSDMFDREAAPTRERRGTGLREGLAALWRAVLREGVMEDGQPTFTSFGLRTDAHGWVRLPRDPLKNPELAWLRARRDELDLEGRLAEVHERLLGQAFSFEPFLALPVVLPAPVMEVAAVLARVLGEGDQLEAIDCSWLCGTMVEISFDGRHAWTVAAAGLRVTLVEAQGGWSHTLSDVGPPSAEVLRDALLAAGW